MPPIWGKQISTSDLNLSPIDHPHKSSSRTRKKIEVTQLATRSVLFSLSFLLFFLLHIPIKIALQERQRDEAIRTANAKDALLLRLRPLCNRSTANLKNTKTIKQALK